MTKEATTEVIMIPLLPGLDLDTGDAKEIWDSTLSTIADQPGYQKIFYGRHPDTLQICISKLTLSPSTPSAAFSPRPLLKFHINLKTALKAKSGGFFFFKKNPPPQCLERNSEYS